ncbi:MAG: nitroreductase family protein [Candidatus Aenigmarchaeota archaeon]
METPECIQGRRDIRSYKPDPVPEDTVRALLKAATEAPSSGNLQNWEFVVVRKYETKKALSGAAMGQEFLVEAPLIVVVCANLELAASKYGGRGRDLYSVQNTAAATENLMLAAWDSGIGTCWVGAFNENDVKRVLNLPENIRPVAIITMGYPEKTPEKPGRRPVEEVMHKELYGGKV